MNEPDFLTLDEVYRIHARSLAEHGGSNGTRDPGLVESALASAKNTFYYANGDLFDVAAVTLFTWPNHKRSLMEMNAQQSRRP